MMNERHDYLADIPQLKNVQSREKPEGSAEEHEQAQGLGIEFFVTDHNLRHPELIPIEKQPQFYAEMKRQGIASVRFDWDWNEIVSAPGQNNRAIIDRYIQAMRMMQEAGLKPPTLVLSNPPEWAMALYKTDDKDSFFRAYREYLSVVASALSEAKLDIHGVQLFNEINNAVVFKFVDTADLPKISDITKEAFGKDRAVKRTASLIVSNTNTWAAKLKDFKNFSKNHGALQFLKDNEELIRNNFESISLDYYPGIWHVPFKTAGYSIKGMYKQLDELKAVCELLASWGIEYEIDEAGFPTNTPYSSEKRQRYFYDVFFREFRKMLVEFRSKGLNLPSRVGLYEMNDEPNTAFGGGIEKALKNKAVQAASKILPNPEGQFGLISESGNKALLRGRKTNPFKRDKNSPEDRLNPLKQMKAELSMGDYGENGEPQLSRIIRYVNRPIADTKPKQQN